MSAKLYQYAEEKAKRLALRTHTDPDILWLRAYVRSRVHQYIEERDRCIADRNLWLAIQRQERQQDQ